MEFWYCFFTILPRTGKRPTGWRFETRSVPVRVKCVPFVRIQVLTKDNYHFFPEISKKKYFWESILKFALINAYVCVFFLFFYTKSCEIHTKSLIKLLWKSNSTKFSPAALSPQTGWQIASTSAGLRDAQDWSHRWGFGQIFCIWVLTRFGRNGQKKKQ